MKKKDMLKKLSLLLVCMCACFLVACSKNNDDDNQPSVSPSAEVTTTDDANGTTDDPDMTNTNDANDQTTTSTGDIPGTRAASEANPINDNIRGYYSETIPYSTLENEIIDELDFEQLDLSKTRYYYNYVDLDDDGIDEIIMQLNGEYTSTDDGDTVLIIEQTRKANESEEDDDGFEIVDKFTMFANPVIISDNTTKGWKDIIFMEPNGDNKTIYKKLVYDGSKYTKIADAEVIENIDDINGVALLCNDIADDTENNNGLYFGASENNTANNEGNATGNGTNTANNEGTVNGNDTNLANNEANASANSDSKKN